MLNLNLLKSICSFVVFLLPFLRIASTCAATTPAATPTTPAPTTTTLDPACNDCSANTVTLTPGNADDGTSTPTETGPTEVNGCQQLTVTCTGQNGGMVFMQFNVNQGGPDEATGTVVNAMLECKNGQWLYKNDRVITEVNCANSN